MPRITLAFGLILVVLGLSLWLGTGRTHTTALIPSFFGIAFVLCGLWARSDKWRKHAMHVAAVLALAGIGGTVRGLIGGIKHLAGTTADRPAAALGQSIMCVLCVAFFVLCLRSFLAARAARKAGS